MCLYVFGRPPKLWREGEVCESVSMQSTAGFSGSGRKHRVAELIYLMTERLISPQP